MKCFVTGAAGFLGTALSNRLVQEGHEVIGLDDCSAGEPLRLLPEVNFVRNDLNSKESLWRLLKNVDVIYHLAAKVIVPDSLLYPGEYEKTNVGGTVTLLEAMHDVGNRKMIFASSGAIYGHQAVMPLQEDMNPRPESPYAVSKLAGEFYIRTIGQLWGLQAVCLRIFNEWKPDAPVFENNVWENGGKPFIRSEIQSRKGMFDKTAFADFLKQLNPDNHDMTGVPRFVDAANRDYRLAPDSVGYGKNIGANPKVTQ